MIDVGARNGVEEPVAKYEQFFSVILCESEKKEALRLQKLGFNNTKH